MKTICGLIVALCLGLTAGAAVAQNYPDRPIRILVGFPPGGPPDVAARILAEKFSETWRRPVVVENLTGGGGNLAIERAAKAPPDGYTLVMASNAIVINPSLYDNLPYDVARDLAPISLAVSLPCILVVNNDLPARSVPELVALAPRGDLAGSQHRFGIATVDDRLGQLSLVGCSQQVVFTELRQIAPGQVQRAVACRLLAAYHVRPPKWSNARPKLVVGFSRIGDARHSPCRCPSSK